MTMDNGSWGLRALRAAGVAVAMAGLLVGCGGGVPDGNEHVEYDGTTLIVEGTPYERDASSEENGDYTPSVIVMRDDGFGAIARAAERYGLEHVGYTAYGEAVLKVPEGYEVQWLKAFRSEALGEQIGRRETRSEPRRIVMTAAGEDVEDDVGESVEEGAVAEVDDADIPADPPTDADVRRLLFERYAVIDEAGGMPATMTANGQQLRLRGHLFSVSNIACKPRLHRPAGEWSCSADTMMGLCNGDCDPSREEPLPSGDRISIHWNTETGRFEQGLSRGR